MRVRRGDIVTVEVDPTRGSEQRGADRPCVVIQNDVGNEHSPTTIVAPFTTQYDPAEVYPFEVEVLAANSALDRDSVVDCSQIRVVDIERRVTKNLGSVPAGRMREIDLAIEHSLGL